MNSISESQPRALQGIRVLDLSRVLAGPWSTQMLADLGAEIIKVERPGEGDDTRKWGPPFVRNEDGSRVQSTYFLCANRGKRSICVDFGRPEGQLIIRELAAQSDVLVENYKVGGLKKFGLDYASLEAVNPRLIYCSITGFGQDGPYAQRPGYDFLIQGMGGLMSITGEQDGEPMKVGVALADIITGLYASNAILGALNLRHRTGVGQHIDIALLDCLIACLANQALSYLVTGEEPERFGNGHPSIVPYELFPTADGHIIVAVGNDAQFRRFCAALGIADLASDARFATNSQRVIHRQELIQLLRERFAQASRAHWLQRLTAADVPSGPINTIRQVFADPQVQHRRMRIETADEELGMIPGVACPIRYSASPVGSTQAPPALGEGTRSVLGSLLAYTSQEMDELRSKGVIA